MDFHCLQIDQDEVRERLYNSMKVFFTVVGNGPHVPWPAIFFDHHLDSAVLAVCLVQWQCNAGVDKTCKGNAVHQSNRVERFLFLSYSPYQGGAGRSFFGADNDQNRFFIRWAILGF